jgi:hypothetical protein
LGLAVSRLLGYLDDWAHRLHLPAFIQGHLCDAFDRSLGVYDEDKP